MLQKVALHIHNQHVYLFRRLLRRRLHRRGQGQHEVAKRSIRLSLLPRFDLTARPTNGRSRVAY